MAMILIQAKQLKSKDFPNKATNKWNRDHTVQIKARSFQFLLFSFISGWLSGHNEPYVDSIPTEELQVKWRHGVHSELSCEFSRKQKMNRQKKHAQDFCVHSWFHRSGWSKSWAGLYSTMLLKYELPPVNYIKGYGLQHGNYKGKM